MKKKVIIGVIVAAVIAIIIALVVVFTRKKKDEYRVIKVQSYNGSVTVNRDAKSEVLEAFEGMTLVSGDNVDVGDSSNLELLMDSDKHMLAEANTSFVLVASGTAKAGAIRIEITKGSSLFEIDNKLNDDSSFEVSTPNAIMSVRGTQFRVTYDKDMNETSLEVIEGVVAVDYADGTTENVEAGESLLINDNGSLEIDVDVTEDNTTEGSSNGTDSGSDDSYTGIMDEDDAIAAYNAIIKDMNNYLSAHTTKGHDYYAFDYMYFDYDGDGTKEVVLYPKYRDAEGTDYRDVVFLDYNEDSHSIVCVGVNYEEANDYTFYAEYNGLLCRYSWRTSPQESYLYYVNVSADGVLSYVLENGYDYIIADPASEGIHPVPLYGDWEMIFKD